MMVPGRALAIVLFRFNESSAHMALRNFFNLFSPRTIRVALRRKEITLSNGSNSVLFNPIVYLHPDSNQVVAVGDPPPSGEATRAIALFDGNDVAEDKTLVFIAFMRYAMIALYKSRLMVRPNFEFDVAPEIEAFFGGYYRLILHHVATKSGAKSTPFDKTYGAPQL